MSTPNEQQQTARTDMVTFFQEWDGRRVSPDGDCVDAEYARLLARDLSAATDSLGQARDDIAEIRRQHQREANEWKTDEELAEQLRIERAAREAAEYMGNLLAIVHRDGGHYVDEHGTVKATDDAINIINDLRQRAESAEFKLKQCDCLQTIAARIVLKRNQCEKITNHDFDELEAAHCAMEKI